MKQVFYKSLIIILMFLSCAALFAQNRGIELQVVTPDGTKVAQFGEAHALIIGESAYNNGWRRLPGVKDDVVAVKRLVDS